MVPLPPPPESLEARIAPAGVVAISFENGVLQLTGDDAANDVEIGGTETGVRISDVHSGGTQFLFGGAMVAALELEGPIRRVAIDLGDGPSKTLSVAGFTVAGNVRVTAEADETVLTFRNVDFRGLTKLALLGSTDQLFISGDTVRMAQGLIVSGGEQIEVDSQVFKAKQFFASDYLFLSLAPQERLAVGARGIALLASQESIAQIVSDQIVVTGGVDLILLNNPSTSITFTIGAFSRGFIGSLQVFAADFSTKPGPLNIGLGIPGGILQVAGGVGITGGDDNDDLSLAGALSIEGGAEFLLRGGSDVINSDDVQTLQISGDVHVATTDGSDVVDLGADGALSIGGDVLIEFAAGENAASLVCRRVTLGGDLSVRTGPGASSLELDFLALENFTVAGGLMVENQAVDVAKLDLTATLLDIEQGITYLGADGPDSINIEATNIRHLGSLDFNPAGGANDVRIAAFGGGRLDSVRYGDGLDDDSFAFQVAVRSVGRIRFDSVAGDNIVTLSPPSEALRLSLNGAVSIKSAQPTATGNTVVSVSGVDAGRFTVSLAAGDDELHISDSVFSLPFVANMGDGADRVSIEAATGALRTRFEDPVSVDLGSGDDQLTLGADQTGSLLVFEAPLAVEAGDGADTLSLVDSAVRFRGGPPVLNGFEFA